MSRLTYDLVFDLETLKCHDEGDGWGEAEPYMWTVFYRIGGEDVSIEWNYDFNTNEVIINLIGTPLIEFGEGSHGNLNDDGVDSGDVVDIPGNVGYFETRLTPIPIPDSLISLGNLLDVDVPVDMPGISGLIVVLMEEDNITDDGANAGHTALNDAIRSAMEDILARTIRISIDNPNVSGGDLLNLDGEMDSLKNDIGSAVENAITNQQSFFENIWAAINPDDQIGFKMFSFTSDDFTVGQSIGLHERWKNEGDWELNGQLIPTVICPSDTIAAILSSIKSSKDFVYDKKTLLKFHDNYFIKYIKYSQLWSLINEAKLSLMLEIVRNESVREKTLKLFSLGQDTLRKESKVLPTEMFDLSKSLLKDLQKSKKHRIKVISKRIINILDQYKGKSLEDLLEFVRSTQLSRKKNNKKK